MPVVVRATDGPVEPMRASTLPSRRGVENVEDRRRPVRIQLDRLVGSPHQHVLDRVRQAERRGLVPLITELARGSTSELLPKRGRILLGKPVKLVLEDEEDVHRCRVLHRRE